MMMLIVVMLISTSQMRKQVQRGTWRSERMSNLPKFTVAQRPCLAQVNVNPR